MQSIFCYTVSCLSYPNTFSVLVERICLLAILKIYFCKRLDSIFRQLDSTKHLTKYWKEKHVKHSDEDYMLGTIFYDKYFNIKNKSIIIKR